MTSTSYSTSYAAKAADENSSRDQSLEEMPQSRTESKDCNPDITIEDANNTEEVTAASAAEALPPPRLEKELLAGAKGDEKDPMKMTKDEMVQEALNCPCIEGMKDGPCGTHFLTAYECFLRSESDPKGSNCVTHFLSMHTCMNEHPDFYDLDDDDEDSPEELRNMAADNTSESNTAKSGKSPAEVPPPTEGKRAEVPKPSDATPTESVPSRPISAACPIESGTSNFVTRGLQRIYRHFY